MFGWLTFPNFLMTTLGLLGLFLIGLILLQRGRGGGLAGAFGGMGGQSAFGTKAGDVFTRITIGVAAAWILLCAGSVLVLRYSTNSRLRDVGAAETSKIEPMKTVPPKSSDEADDGGQQKGRAAKNDDEKDPRAAVVPENPDAEKAKGDKEPAADAKAKAEAKPVDDANGADKPKPE